MLSKVSTSLLVCGVLAAAFISPALAENSATTNPGDSTSEAQNPSAAGSATNLLGKVKRFSASFRLNSPPARDLRHASDEQLCGLLGPIADEHDLPLEFFWRLIWQESRFNPFSVSNKGAQGIAQFMPGTARERGLADPFEPIQALKESARFLRELLDHFGNVGLAAAAYNGGAQRVRNWLSGGSGLPGETRAYVRIITGRTADEWAQAGLVQPSPEAKSIPCEQIAKTLRPVSTQQVATINAAPASGPHVSTWKPWGLQLGGDWSETKVLNQYRRLQERFPAVLGSHEPLVVKGAAAGRGSATWYRVRVAESTREAANQLCTRLEAAGGRCVVFHN